MAEVEQMKNLQKIESKKYQMKKNGEDTTALMEENERAFGQNKGP